MKRVIAALVLLLIIVVGSAVSLHSGSRQFNYLIGLAARAEECYCSGNTAGALAAAETLAEEFPKRTKHFAMFLPHQALTDVEKSTSSLPLILKYGEPRDFAAEARRCRLMLERLWAQELPLPQNII